MHRGVHAPRAHRHVHTACAGMLSFEHRVGILSLHLGVVLEAIDCGKQTLTSRFDASACFCRCGHQTRVISCRTIVVDVIVVSLGIYSEVGSSLHKTRAPSIFQSTAQVLLQHEIRLLSSVRQQRENGGYSRSIVAQYCCPRRTALLL